MKDFKNMTHWFERYAVGKNKKEKLSLDVISLGLSDEDSSVRAVFLGRQDFKISEAQIEAAINDSSPMVKIALIRRSDVVFNEIQANKLSNDVWPLVREIFAENYKKCNNNQIQNEEIYWWNLIPFSLAT